MSKHKFWRRIGGALLYVGDHHLMNPEAPINILTLKDIAERGVLPIARKQQWDQKAIRQLDVMDRAARQGVKATKQVVSQGVQAAKQVILDALRQRLGDILPTGCWLNALKSSGISEDGAREAIDGDIGKLNEADARALSSLIGIPLGRQQKRANALLADSGASNTERSPMESLD